MRLAQPSSRERGGRRAGGVSPLSEAPVAGGFSGGSRPPLAKRGGFTLLELLVVIAIIAVLASLLLAAIFKATLVARQVQTRNDLSQLEAAVASFQQDFQVDYLPSYIQNGDPFLSRLYPQAGSNWLPYGSLAGNQSLVFFLMGPTGQGFSADPSNPTRPAGQIPGEIRRGPYYTFPANRVSNGMFLDPYGKPYAYFAAVPAQTPLYSPGTENQSIGCPGPYVSPTTNNFINPNSCQIISAGPNMTFNQGNVWPGVAPFGPGADDIANFATAQLGAGQ